MMTEDQAREKWCPHSGTKDEKTGSCIASRCSQWRWVRELKVFEADPGLSAEVDTDKGYCGLAGQP